MLKQRILTAVILLPLFLGAMFYLPIYWVTILFAAIIGAAAWEWADLSGLRQLPGKLIYVSLILIFGLMGLNVIELRLDLMIPLLGTAVLWWFWATIEVFFRPPAARGLFSTRIGRLVGGVLVLFPLWMSSIYLLVIDAHKPRLLLFLFVLVWIADSAAYFAGSQFGKTKLAPNISPGKTVEGVMGGVLSVVLLAWLCGTMIWKLETSQLVLWLCLAITTVLFSVVGDLMESKLKRQAGAKDSGKLLPGHGGVLDRIDALTAAAPAFSLGIILLIKL